jgi:hypothetical protein
VRGFKRSVLAVSAGIALLATGCGSGTEVIPLADVPAPKENANKSKTVKPPPGVPTSSRELIYK